MKTLVTGKGFAGSWKIRGEQLGHAIGADVRVDASSFGDADLVVVVKKWTPGVAIARQRYDGVVALDIVDGWPQSTVKTIEKACQHVCSAYNRLGADFAIFATEAQMVDLPDLPGFVLPHHHRPGIERNPIRPEVKTVGYEGSPRYLAQWAREEVEARGWKLVVNPKRLADVDIAIATRGVWDSDVVRRWKSNVKLANCQGSGTPCVLPYEHGYLEQDRNGPLYYRTREEFGECLDALRSQLTRQARAMVLAAGAPTLDRIAQSYRAKLKSWFQRVGGQTRANDSSRR